VSQSIAIVGASARAAAFSAQRVGFHPVAADLFADADLGRLCPATRIDCYPDDFLPWLRDAMPDAWMYTGALENYPELVDAMAGVAPLWGNAGDLLRGVRSPWKLADALHEANLLFPETRPMPEGLPRDGSWLTKTYRGASGCGVNPFDIPLPDREGPGEGSYVYQQRIAGETCCGVYVAHDGKADLLGVTRQLTGEPWLGAAEFQYCGSIGLHRFGPEPLHLQILDLLGRIGRVLTERFALRGLFGVDVIVGKDTQVWALEVNPRYTASVEIVERSTGIATLGLHAAACCGREFEHLPAFPIAAPCHGKAILFAKQDVTVSAQFADWALEQALAMPWPTLADVPAVGTAIARGRPILTLFADGPTPQEVEERLHGYAADLENRLYTPAGTRP